MSEQQRGSDGDQTFIDEVLSLDSRGHGYDLWKHFQARADMLRDRLWTTGTWLIALLGALLALANQAGIIIFVEPVPGVAVVKPWAALAISVMGVALCAHMYSVIADHVDHVVANWRHSDYARKQDDRAPPRSTDSEAGSAEQRAGAAGSAHKSGNKDGSGRMARLVSGRRHFFKNAARVRARTLVLVGALFSVAYVGLLVLSVLTLLGVSVAGAAERQVTLLTVNDIYRITGVERGRRGGVARLRSLRRELETSDPNLLVLHGGDVIYPSLLSRTYGGAQMIDLLNALDGDTLGFDSRFFAVFGNHEFDKRKLADADILAARVAASQFTWLRSNVAFATDPAGMPLVGGVNLKESELVTVNGVKVGLFGLTIGSAKPAYVVDFGDPITVARRLAGELRRQGAELVIALTHLTLDEDRTILETLGADGPDLIIGGHEHVRQEATVKGRRVLKADADAVSALVVRVTPGAAGQPPAVEREWRDLAGDQPLPDKHVHRLARSWHHRHNVRFCAKESASADCLDTPIGTAAVELVAEEERIRACETNFGSWIADQARAAFPGADGAFINAGSLRLNQNLPAGPVLRRDIEELFQYDNRLLLIEIDAATLQRVVNHAVTDWPGSGRWLQISGFTFRHDRSDPDTPKADRLALLGPDGGHVEIEAGRLLRVVTSDFLLDPKFGDQDGYTMLDIKQVVAGKDHEISLKEAVREAFARAGDRGIAPRSDGRIVGPGLAPCTAGR